MAYLDELIERQHMLDNNPLGANLGGPQGFAYSEYNADYLMSSPQYVAPSPYSLAQVGYRVNEIVYALVNKRRRTMATKSVYLRVMDESGEHPEEMDGHKLSLFMRRPNPYLSGRQFLSITELGTTVSGAQCWEKERDNYGRVIALWPMRPDWCSYMAGQGKPIRAVRYQPYGMGPRDIPVENIVIFGTFGDNFDPLYPMLKPMSPVSVALRQIGVDNDATDFLKVFFQEGAQFSAHISSPNSISDQEAERMQSRLAQYHGGARNWARVLVLSNGAELKPNQFTFKDMAFPEIDARTEARLCSLLEVPPILVGAKVGLSVTYKNYEESHKGFMREFAVPRWQYFADEIKTQLLPDFDNELDYRECEYETSGVAALQEDRKIVAESTALLARTNVLSRNQALEEIGKDPVDFDDNGDPVHVYLGVTVRETVNQTTDVLGAQATQPLEPTTDEGVAQSGDTTVPVQAAASATNPSMNKKPSGASSPDAQETVKFKRFAKSRTKEGKMDEISSFPFKVLTEARQKELIREAMTSPVKDMLQKVLAHE